MANLIARLLDLLLSRSAQAQLRLRVGHNADLLGKLPTESGAHQTLAQHLDGQVRALVAFEQRPGRRRNPSSIVAGAFVVAMFAVPTYYFVRWGSWWWIPAAFTGLVTVAAFVAFIGELRGHTPDDATDEGGQA